MPMTEERFYEAQRKFREDAERFKQIVLPPVGDPAKRYPVELTEPEINTIYALFSFVKAACSLPHLEYLQRFWEHYGPTAEALSGRLTVFDDDPYVSFHVEPAPPSPCPICQSVGKRSDGEYCTCAMGSDLRRAEERLKRAAPEPPYHH